MGVPDLCKKRRFLLHLIFLFGEEFQFFRRLIELVEERLQLLFGAFLVLAVIFILLLVAITAAVILGYRLTGRALIGMEGVLTCIIGPGAAAAAVVTSKLGGNLESMTTYTFLSNFVTALLVPLIFPLIDPDVTMTFWKSFKLPF